MKRDIEHQGIHLSTPIENPGEQDKMGRAADRKKFGNSLNNAQDN